MPNLNAAPGKQFEVRSCIIIPPASHQDAGPPAHQNTTPEKEESENYIGPSPLDSGYYSEDLRSPPDSNLERQSSLTQDIENSFSIAVSRKLGNANINSVKHELPAPKGFPESINSFLKLRGWREQTRARIAMENLNSTRPPARKVTLSEEHQSIDDRNTTAGTPENSRDSLSKLTELQEAIIDIRAEEFAPNLESPTPQQRTSRHIRTGGAPQNPRISRIKTQTQRNPLFIPRSSGSTHAGPSRLNTVMTAESSSTPLRADESSQGPWNASASSEQTSHFITPVTNPNFPTLANTETADLSFSSRHTNAGHYNNNTTPSANNPKSGTNPLAASFVTTTTPETALFSPFLPRQLEPAVYSSTELVPYLGPLSTMEKATTSVPQDIERIADMVQERQSQRQQLLGHAALQAFRPSHTVQRSSALLGNPSSSLQPTQGPLIPYLRNANISYQGDLSNALNRSALIPDSENCSLWLTGLPPSVTYSSLLGSIRNTGALYASVINGPDCKHSTSAAKLVFMSRAAAESLLRQISSGSFHVNDVPVTHVRWNKIRVPPYPQPDHSRVIRIQGPGELMDKAFLERFFRERFTFDLDRVVDVWCKREGEGWFAQEWHFGSLRSQAASAKMAVERELQGIYEVAWARDPCAFA